MNSIDSNLPSRFERPSIVKIILLFLFACFLVESFRAAEVSLRSLIEGIPYMGEMFSEMLPPDFSRGRAISIALLQTFQMAFVGAFLGIVISIPLAICASKSHSPNSIVYYISRLLVSLFRTVPDLIWALVFVIAVGVGPFAGTLALMIDTIGFCGRFFAEAMEEVPKEPQEGLTAIGASRLSVIFCAVFPAALPSIINSSLFSIEKATRSSVVLGLVGAGGIGVELSVAMNTFHYAQAASIILCILVLVLIVENISQRIRRKVM